MIERVIAAGVPFSWVAADAVYGVGDIEMMLRRAGKGYVLGVETDHRFNSCVGKPSVAGTAEVIANGFAPSAWTRLSAGEGTKGARRYDWTYCALADLAGADDDQAGVRTRRLRIRRSPADGERASFTTWCPAGTSIQALVAVEGRHWTIEDAFETAKSELGPAYNETRSSHGWHRHVSLMMMASALLAEIRRHANASLPKSRARPRSRLPRYAPTDTMVGEGDPPPRRAAGAAAHLPRSRHRMVALATRASSSSPQRPSQTWAPPKVRQNEMPTEKL